VALVFFWNEQLQRPSGSKLKPLRRKARCGRWVKNESAAWLHQHRAAIEAIR
jgi:hypothetical protein